MAPIAGLLCLRNDAQAERSENCSGFDSKDGAIVAI
jgi:hypothetical protein